jgi:outer membrane receptor protein involved in Fe transport
VGDRPLLLLQPPQPEQLDAYEFGFKNELFRHRARLNVSAFYYDYKEIRVPIFNLPQTIVNGSGVQNLPARPSRQGMPLKILFHTRPTFTFPLGVDYTVPSDVSSFTLNLNDSYNSGFYGEPDHRLRQQSFHCLNTAVAWNANDEHTTVRVYGNNLNRAVANQFNSHN